MKYIEREKVFEALQWASDSSCFRKAYDKMKTLPTTEIVRCKECKNKYVTGITTQYYVCDFMDAQFDENGYCHHGERIDNE